VVGEAAVGVAIRRHLRGLQPPAAEHLLPRTALECAPAAFSGSMSALQLRGHRGAEDLVLEYV
jgi:hypothetical protein